MKNQFKHNLALILFRYELLHENNYLYMRPLGCPQKHVLISICAVGFPIKMSLKNMSLKVLDQQVFYVTRNLQIIFWTPKNLWVKNLSMSEHIFYFINVVGLEACYCSRSVQ